MKRTPWIKGYEGWYRITKNGFVLSVSRWRKGKAGSFAISKSKVLKKNINKNGYETVILCKNSEIKGKLIHRLVYETFVGVIEKDKQINHKDGNKQNNHISNLESVSPKENMQHAWKTGLCKKRLGTELVFSKLNNKKIRKIRNMSENGVSQKEIGNIFNVHQSNISYIISRKTWSHIK